MSCEGCGPIGGFYAIYCKLRDDAGPFQAILENGDMMRFEPDHVYRIPEYEFMRFMDNLELVDDH